MSGETGATRGVADRGTAASVSAPPDPLAAAVARLREVARLTRGGAALQWTHSVLDPARDHTFLSVLGPAYESFGLVPPVSRPIGPRESVAAYVAAVLEPRNRRVVAAYRADLERLAGAVQEAAGLWVLRATNDNLRVLAEIRFEVLAPEAIAGLHKLARRFTTQRNRLLHGEPRETAGFRNPVVARVEEDLAAQFDDPWARVFFAQPGRVALLEGLAASRTAAAEAVRRVLDDARQGIDDFALELEENPEHVWRYAPVVVGACQGLGFANDPQLVAFVLKVARARSEGALGVLFFVAGTAVMAAALVASGPAALLVLGALDLALAGLEAYLITMREWENDRAEAAGVLGRGQALTDRPSSYGPALLAGAAALLSAYQLPALLRAFRQTRRAAAVAEGIGSAADAPAVRDGDPSAGRGTSDRGVSDAGELGSRRGTQDPPEPAARTGPGEGEAVREVPVARAATERLPEPVAEAFEVLRGRGLLRIADGVLEDAVLIGRGAILVLDRWLDGALYLARGVYYFVVDAAKGLTVRIGARLDEWAFNGTGGIAMSMLGFGAVPDAARAAYRLVRTRFVKAVTPAELKVLEQVEAAGWHRVAEYALDNRNVHSVKGKVAEELIGLTAEYRRAWDKAVALAAAEDFPPGSVKFYRDVKGVVVSKDGEGIGELTDGIIAAIDEVEGGPPIVRVFAVFESKSPSNVRELAKRRGESLGQPASDHERFRELPTFIDGVRYDPNQVFVSRRHTDWLAMTPPGKGLSEAKREWIRAGLPQFEPFEAPVRTSILEAIARRIISHLP